MVASWRRAIGMAGALVCCALMAAPEASAALAEMAEHVPTLQALPSRGFTLRLTCVVKVDSNSKAKEAEG